MLNVWPKFIAMLPLPVQQGNSADLLHRLASDGFCIKREWLSQTQKHFDRLMSQSKEHQPHLGFPAHPPYSNVLLSGESAYLLNLLHKTSTMSLCHVLSSAVLSGILTCANLPLGSRHTVLSTCIMCYAAYRLNSFYCSRKFLIDSEHPPDKTLTVSRFDPSPV